MPISSKFFPFITVCMPVRNEARFVQDLLVQLLAQDYPKDRYEIIVADGESDDGTPNIVQFIAIRHPQVILKSNPKRLSSAGRNIGFKAGKGDIFLVVDGHCYIPTRKLFKNIVRCFEISGADCLGRPQPLDPPGMSNFQKAVALSRKSIIGHGRDSLIYSDLEGFVSPVSHGAVYKRNVFSKIGFVDESFDVCEDVEFNLRVEKSGMKTYMSPSIAVKYYPRDTFGSLFKQMVRYGVGRVRLLKKHSCTFSLNTMVPPLFLLGLVVLPFTIFSKVIGIIGFSVFSTYLSLLLSISIVTAIKRNLAIAAFIPLILLTIHTGLGYGILKEALMAKKKF